jgi:hypothetical protein
LAPASGELLMFTNGRKLIVSFVLISVPELKKKSGFAVLCLRFLPLGFSP